jgi:branched-chain amino acid transport system substrate-binding protein
MSKNKENYESESLGADPNVRITDYQPSEQPLSTSVEPQSDTDKPNRKTKKWLVAAAVIGLAILIGGAVILATKDDSKTSGKVTNEIRVIKVGLLGPLSGSHSRTIATSRQSIDLAIKEFNKEGVRVELLSRETECDAKLAEVAIKDLIAEKVVAILGDFCSGATLAAAPFANKERIPMISPTSTSPKITDSGDYIFRTIPSDALQGKFVAELISAKGLKNLAIIYGNEPYGIGLSTSLKTNFESMGGRVTNVPFENGATDLTNQFKLIKNVNPDAVYLISNEPTSAVAVIIGVKNAGIKAQLFGAESIKSQIILNDAASAAEGMTVSSVSLGTPAFVDKFRAAYQSDPDDFAAQAYDAARLLTAAFAGGAYTSEAIKNAVSKSDMQGVSGRIKFDKNGDIPGNYDTYTVKNGKFIIVNK